MSYCRSPHRPLRSFFVLCYLLVAVGAMLWHVHDGDAFAGYDEHCISCHWTFHTPLSLAQAYQATHALMPTDRYDLAFATPASRIPYTRHPGRSPPFALS